MSALNNQRIAFMMGNLELGGAERQALYLACYLRDKHRAQVEFWGMAITGPRLISLLEEENIPYFVFKEPTRRWFGYIKWSRLLRFLWMARKRKADILLGYLIESNVLGALYKNKAGAQLFVWNQRDCGLFFRKTAITDKAIEMTEHFVTNSEGGRQFLIETAGADSEKITLINNAVYMPSTKISREIARRQYGLAENDVAIAMVANLHESKDHETLIRAIHLLPERTRQLMPIKLFLAGRWDSTYDQLKALVESLHLDQVHFLGQVKEIPELWQAMDIGVLCSPSEGTPNAILEAMAMAKPVVGTDIPGIRGALGPENRELLYPHQDALKLSQILDRLILAPDLRLSIGLYNKERIKTHFDAHEVQEQYAQYLIKKLKK